MRYNNYKLVTGIYLIYSDSTEKLEIQNMQND
jgi:hypothetical protein